ncbi:MAG TPA: M1 family metallopeptidase [Aequorivita sp.]|nr:M1 family metallopeptidase [Aequorivita sp.]
MLFTFKITLNLRLQVVFFFLLLLISSKIYGQQTEVVNFLKVKATVEPDFTQKSIKGIVEYSFKILQNTDSVYLDAKEMRIIEFFFKDGRVEADKEKIWLIGNFKKEKLYTVNFTYNAEPKQTLYFFPLNGDGSDSEIWTQGQGKYTSHWLPSLDDTNDKIEFDLTVVAPLGKTVIANGKLVEIEKTTVSQKWHFDMENPMSSYLVAFAIGGFDKKELLSNSGIPIELYYKPQDSLKFEPTYRYSKEIFNFLEEEIGFPYPWQNYKQVPLRDFLYAGMENTSATFFSEAFVVDSIGFNDRNYVNVNAHELAHQWFGNTVTTKTDEDHWLQEGFATYYALLAEKEIFGADYYYWQLYQSSEQLKAASDEGKGESLLNPKASSLTFYQKGAWALHVLREMIGDVVFKTAVKNYLEKYKFQNVTTEDFLNEVKAATQIDISLFVKDWLHQSAFKAEDAFNSLLKSNFIKNYFEVAILREIPISNKKVQLKNALTFPNDFIGQEAVYQLADEDFLETLSLYKTAFESNNLYVRQEVALSLKTIPKELQTEYESLLNDDSYVTLETALYQMCMQFPEKRIEYLEKTRGVIGFQNRNIRQLWLALALITENYRDSEKPRYLMELKHYTSTDYSFEIRDKAFLYVEQLQLWDNETLTNLVEAGVHPTWRFAKASKELLNAVVQEPENYEKMKVIGKQLSPKAAAYLNSIIKE